MAAPTPMRYLGILAGVATGREPALQIVVGSREQIRELPLTRNELVRIIAGAARALEQLDRDDAAELKRLRAADRQAALENER